MSKNMWDQLLLSFLMFYVGFLFYVASTSFLSFELWHTHLHIEVDSCMSLTAIQVAFSSYNLQTSGVVSKVYQTDGVQCSLLWTFVNITKCLVGLVSGVRFLFSYCVCGHPSSNMSQTQCFRCVYMLHSCKQKSGRDTRGAQETLCVCVFVCFPACRCSQTDERSRPRPQSQFPQQPGAGEVHLQVRSPH